MQAIYPASKREPAANKDCKKKKPSKRKSCKQLRPDVNVLPHAIGPIKHPNNNDVLCGRGGRTNTYQGNIQYRDIVTQTKPQYLAETKKLQKRFIAAGVVEKIRAMDPPGRFLREEFYGGPWYDIGDEEAYSKTIQALREARTARGGSSENDTSSDVKVRSNEKQSTKTPSLSQAIDVTEKKQQNKNIKQPKMMKINIGKALMKAGGKSHNLSRATKSQLSVPKEHDNYSRKPTQSVYRSVQQRNYLESPFEEISFSKPFHSVDEDISSELSKLSSIKGSELSKLSSIREMVVLQDNIGNHDMMSQNHHDRRLRAVGYKKGGYSDKEVKRISDSIRYREPSPSQEITFSKNFFPVGEGVGSEISSAFDGSKLSSSVMEQSICSEDMGTIVDSMSLGTNISHLDRSVDQSVFSTMSMSHLSTNFDLVSIAS